MSSSSSNHSSHSSHSSRSDMPDRVSPPSADDRSPVPGLIPEGDTTAAAAAVAAVAAATGGVATAQDSRDSRDIIVLGASAGGLNALQQLVRGLPADFSATLFVVVHVPPSGPSVLPELLTRAGPLPAAHAVDGESIERGRIYVAPPDRHLILAEAGTIRLSAGPRENHSRPAVDPLFRSAALVYGPRVIGIVLSGALSDGTAGLWEIKQRGGLAIVQDPGEAVYPSMPHSAMDQVPVDYVLPVAEMPQLLAKLVRSTDTELWASSNTDAAGVAAGMAMQHQTSIEEKPGSQAVERDMAAQVAGERNGEVTVYVCPDCGGSLWQANAGPLVRFRCHVGHIYSGDNLLEGYTEDMERSLWKVVRTLRDKANLTRQLAVCARQQGNEGIAVRYEKSADTDEEHSAVFERMIGEVTAANRQP